MKTNYAILLSNKHFYKRLLRYEKIFEKSSQDMTIDDYPTNLSINNKSYDWIHNYSYQ